MPSILDSVYTKPSSLGVQYQRGLIALLASLLRHKLLIMAVVTTAMAIGIVAMLLMPKQYTSEAYIRGGFGTPDAVAQHHQGQKAPIITLDALLVVETRARLFQSHEMARRVVEQLGVERLGPALGEGPISWLTAKFHGDATRTPRYQRDMAVRRLSRGLSVTTEPRQYLIVLQYATGDPELAAVITNAFVAEFLRAITLQIFSEQRDLVQTELSELLTTLGDRHPRVIEARARLATADSLVKDSLNRKPLEILRSAGDDVMLARAVFVPSSPNPPLFLVIALLTGLLTGIGLALWLEWSPQEGRARQKSGRTARQRPQRATR